jgi:hypothetical protein
LVLFRLRRRGSAVEAVVCDLLLPEPSPEIERSLLRAVARSTAATYLIRLGRPIIAPGPFVRVPRIGPTLTCRRLDGAPVPPLRDWDLTLGDVELL